MTIYAVFIYCTVPGYHYRWIDSQFASEKHASKRMAELDTTLAAFRCEYHKTAIHKLSIQDAEATPKEK